MLRRKTVIDAVREFLSQHPEHKDNVRMMHGEYVLSHEATIAFAEFGVSIGKVTREHADAFLEEFKKGGA
jgi:hypothetical protein